MLVDAAQDLTDQDYELIRRLVYEQSGINLGAQKHQLVRARLGKRLRSGRFKTFRAYYNYVKEDATGGELCALLDAISTNTTHLFRERQHFEFLGETLRRAVADRAWRAANRTLRLWSAGCSSGEEPHSLAMTVDDALGPQPALDWRILATDISTRALDRARAGVYELQRLGTVPRSFQQRYFVPDEADPRAVRIAPALARQISFARLNLMADRFPFRYGFNYIFCRNVMIYFDRPTQQRLVAKLAVHLRPGGYLIIGHSESLNGVQHPLRYDRPTIFQSPPS